MKNLWFKVSVPHVRGKIQDPSECITPPFTSEADDDSGDTHKEGFIILSLLHASSFMIDTSAPESSSSQNGSL